MSYRPQDQPQSVTKELSQRIVSLPPEQRAAIYDRALSDLPEAEKANFVRLLPPPITEQQQKMVENLPYTQKVSNADLIATKLPLEQQKRLSEEVQKMLKEAEAKVHGKRRGPGDDEADDQRPATAHHPPGRHHATARSR